MQVPLSNVPCAQALWKAAVLERGDATVNLQRIITGKQEVQGAVVV
jgi:hypothetical protein